MKMQRGLTAKRLFITAVLLLLSSGAAIGSGTALGFVTQSGEILEPPRWSNVEGSLVEQGVRGLGGGIEYAIADDFCERLIPSFIDNPKPTCEQLKDVIKRAFDKWAAGHPVLRFTDVTGKIKAERPEGGQSGINLGAEIDFIAVSQIGYSGFVEFWTEDQRPIGTNGKVLPGKTITTADILISDDLWCRHLDPALPGRHSGGPCIFFEATILHEIGHALGLHHPDQYIDSNYDSDDDPTNPIPIDCEDSTKGLKLFRQFDPKAVMISIWRVPGWLKNELQNDDIGGRNFLYPICPSTAHGGADLASLAAHPDPSLTLAVYEEGTGEGPGVQSERSVWAITSMVSEHWREHNRRRE
jgi:hypothetical protein